ncbi:MAG TPA: hypothetical protein DDW52_03815, partial [Planctomycetaceae bacterium]|nr:hypothetical protein [Planctomycetaceae bacterium]
QGTVYESIQLSTKRKVAVKFMLAGCFASESAKRRFEREVELISRLQHPGLVRIFDSGLADGQYFYAMEFIEGLPLDKYVQQRQPTQREVVALFVEVCEAVNYAQQHGVIHRDLKPSNILLDANGRPRVLDFGLAKSIDQEIGAARTVSQTGQVMGTLAYMSPEQASGRSGDVDTRTDVYSLGMVLHELLTGELPYSLDFSLAENLSAIKNSEPTLAVLKQKGLRSELAIILIRALQKDRDRRYQTAGALGDDLQRYLKGEPIEAKRDSTLYVLGKILRRNYQTATLAAVILILTLVSSVVSLALYFDARDARDLARLSAKSTEKQRDAMRVLRDQSVAMLYAAEMNLAGQAASKPGGILRVEEIVEAWGNREDADHLRGWEWYYLNSLRDREALNLDLNESIWDIQWHPTQDRLCFADQVGRVFDWKIKAGPKLVGKLESQVRAVAWNSEGTLLAAAGPISPIRVWDANSHEQILEISHSEHALTLGWHPKKPQQLAFACVDGRGEIWEVESKQRIQEFKWSNGIQRLQWSANGQRLLLACHNRKTVVWDVRKREFRQEFFENDSPVFAACWRPGHHMFLSGTTNGTISLMDNREPQTAIREMQMDSFVTNLCWNQEGNSFAAVGKDRILRIYNARFQIKSQLRGHTGAIWGLDWKPDDSLLATSGLDGTIRVWRPDAPTEYRSIRRWADFLDTQIQYMELSPNGEQLAICGAAFEICLMDLATEEIPIQLEGRQHEARCVSWSPDGTRVAASGYDRVVTIWNVKTQRQELVFKGHLKELEVKDPNIVHSVTWSPDGTQIASSAQDGTVIVWDSRSGETLFEHKEAWLVPSIAWHPTQGVIAIAGHTDTKVKLWEPHKGKEPETVATFEDSLSRVQWSPDGSRLAASCLDGSVQVIDAQSRTVQYVLKQHSGKVNCLAWSPSGDRLVTGGEDRTLRIWDTARGVQTLAIPAHEKAIHAVAWSPEGEKIFSGGLDGQLNIWDASIGIKRAESAELPRVRAYGSQR